MELQFTTDFWDKLKRISNPQFSRKTIQAVGIIAVNFSKDRFVKKNWISNRREPWKAREKKTKGSILVQSGRLKRSIRKIAEGNTHVIVGTDAPYAKIHNEGGKITKTVQVKAHTRTRTTRATSLKTGRKLKKRISTGQTTIVKAHSRKMNLTIEKRQFLGESPYLERQIQKYMINEIEKQLNK